MPDDVRLRVKEQIASEESGLLDTHPSPSQRLANTNQEPCDGAIDLNMPATVLFRDFEEVCRLASREHYNVCIEPDPSEFELISVAELIDQEDELSSGEEAIGRYFGAVPAVDLVAKMTEFTPDPAASVSDMRKLMNEVQADMDVAAATVGEIIRRSDSEPTDGEKATVHDYFQKASQRMLTVFRLLDVCETEDESEPMYRASKQVAGLMPAFMELATQATPILAIHEKTGILATHFDSLAKNDQDVMAFNAMSKSFEELKKQIRAVTDALSAHDYPFSHAFDAVSLADFILPSVPEEGDFLGYHGAAENLVDAYAGVLYRVLGVLSRVAIEVEAIIELGPPPDVTVSASRASSDLLPPVEAVEPAAYVS
ncbi:MAG: hypothetical protein HOH43_25875 [Candidatus Latescibacteria bacterium]|nr:hypothetical protein [Candidatus Latescibacterota bacterium]